jgi:hypothetical protein
VRAAIIETGYEMSSTFWSALTRPRVRLENLQETRQRWRWTTMNKES